MLIANTTICKACTSPISAILGSQRILSTVTHKQWAVGVLGYVLAIDFLLFIRGILPSPSSHFLYLCSSISSAENETHWDCCHT